MIKYNCVTFVCFPITLNNFLQVAHSKKSSENQNAYVSVRAS